MGVLVSKVTKPLKTFNIENRARKILDSKKPRPAPRLPSTEQQLKMAKDVNPNFMEEHYKKDEQLMDRLKQVYVSSNVTQINNDGTKSEKFPSNRTLPDDFEYGFWEPSGVQPGRCLLRDLLKFMGDHTTNPEVNNVKKISEDYKLDLKDVEHVLEYYRVLQVIVEKDDEEGLLYIPKKQIEGNITDK